MDEPPAPELLSKRTFTTVTTTANALIKKCKAAPDEDKLALLVPGLEKATKEYLSIMLEKLELPEIITHTPKASFLYKLDLSTLFTMEAEDIKKATVSVIKIGHFYLKN